jgi:ribosomal protein L1
MSKNSKAYREAAEKVDKDKLYSPLEAAKLAKETSSKKQDATVEVAIRLGVDPRKADQMVRGTVSLPHGTGKTARVAVFAVGEKAEEALAAGADVVGSDDLIEKIQDLVMVLHKMEIYIVMISLQVTIKVLHLLQMICQHICDSTGMLDLQKTHSMKVVPTMALNFCTRLQIKEKTGKRFQLISPRIILNIKSPIMVD